MSICHNLCSHSLYLRSFHFLFMVKNPAMKTDVQSPYNSFGSVSKNGNACPLRSWKGHVFLKNTCASTSQNLPQSVKERNVRKCGKSVVGEPTHSACRSVHPRRRTRTASVRGCRHVIMTDSRNSWWCRRRGLFMEASKPSSCAQGEAFGRWPEHGAAELTCG